MTLSRWRRIATGIAAGVIVLCAALLGASFRGDTDGVSVASEVRPSVIIPIEEDDTSADEAADDSEPGDASVTTGEADDEVAAADTTPDTDADANADAGDTAAAADNADSDAPDAATDDSAAADAAADGAEDDDAPLTEPVRIDGTDDEATDESTADDAASSEASSDDVAADDAATSDDESATAPPAAPLPSGDSSLGTGGGVDDAECALDRLVIYAGARVGGVASSIRAALAQAGFGAGCPTPVTVLASNCPLQFAGVLGAGSGYDPAKSFVAASDNVDRETMTAVMGSVGYAGSQIDILDFGFVNADQPGEQWMAIFVPPSFSGWEDLAARAGLAPTTQSLCAPSGPLAG